MSDFDPYLKWLGIRESTRPINHYRLLGLDLFESDPDVISMAADRQMAHIRTYQNGPHGEISQQILNELARARRCLLIADQKAAYDEELRLAQVRVAPSPEIPSSGASNPTLPLPTAGSSPTGNQTPPAGNAEAPVAVGIVTDPTARKKAKGREQKQLIWSILGWISGGLAAVGVSAALISSGVIPLAGGDDDQNLAQQNSPKVDLQGGSDPASSTKPSLNDNPSTSPVTGSANGSPKTDPTDITAGSPSTDSDDSNLVDGDTELADDPSSSENSSPDDGPNRVVIKGPIMPASGPWSLGNSSEYPVKPDKLVSAIEKISAELSNDKVAMGAPSNSFAGQTQYRDLPGQPSILIGMRICLEPRTTIIAALQPIYLHQDGIVAGKMVGRETKFQRDVIAKPGYVVASLSVSPLSPMRSLAVQFARLNGSELDLEDVYWSERYGFAKGPVLRLETQHQTAPRIGVQIGMKTPSDPDEQPFVSSIALFTPGEGVPVAGMGEDPFAPDATPSATASKMEKPKRTAVPSKNDLASAMARLSRRYERRLRVIAREPNLSTRRDLSLQLVRLLKDDSVNEDTAGRYALLRRALEISIETGSVANVQEISAAIDSEFDVAFWEDAPAVIVATAINVPATEQDQLKQFVDALVVRAIEEKNFEAVSDLVDRLTKLAGRNTQMRNYYRQFDADAKELKRLLDGYDKAMKTIETTPDDAKANQVIGDYLFLYGTQAKAAYPYWVKTELADQVKVAQLELADGAEPDRALNLAIAWHRLGKGKHSLKRIKALTQAERYYEQVLDTGDDQARKRAESELENIRQKTGNATVVDELFF